MHRMLTRSTFAHAQNDSGSPFHSLAGIPCPFLKMCLKHSPDNEFSIPQFCAKSECASGTRLVHVLWFLLIFKKKQLILKIA